MSGQLVKFHKSAYQCMLNTSPLMASSFANLFHMEEFLSSSKYLGSPIIDSKNTNAAFGDTQEKVYAPLPKWKLMRYLNEVVLF